MKVKKKIVAIGGGHIGGIKLDKTLVPYETEPMDREIISLTGKEHPNILILTHAKPRKEHDEVFRKMKDIFEGKYGCKCSTLLISDLSNYDKVTEEVNNADVIYEVGGDTYNMIKLWRDKHFDEVLRNAWENGKVMCGISAGANCWFSGCSTDVLKILYGDDQPLVAMECLGFVKAFLVPHSNYEERRLSTPNIIRQVEEKAILLSNCAAIEIVDTKYRIITSNSSDNGVEAFAKLAYYENGEYKEKDIEISNKFKSLKQLLK